MEFRFETEFKKTEIGEIPKDWEVKKLGEVVEFVKGVSYKSSKINSSQVGYIFITLNNFLRGGGFKDDEFKYYTGSEAKKEQFVNRGDLIIALTDMTSEAKVVGAPALVKLPKEYDTGVISLDCAKAIMLDDNYSKEYLYLYLKASQEENATFANGVNVLHLNLELFTKQKLVPYPPLPEQSRIATVLSYFDDLIENKKKQNKILEEMAMAIFKNWFIDFEPFKDGEFVYSEELGKEIPKGWEVLPLSETAEIIIGQSPPSQYYNQEGVGLPFIQGKGHLGKFTPQTGVWCTYKGKVSKLYDILLTVRAPVGELCISEGEYILGRGVSAIRSKNWVYIYLFLSIFNDALKYMERGTTYDAITKEEIEKFKILLPPPPILSRFNSLVEPLFQKIILNQKQIMTLKKIRDALLPQLVFGKLRVEEL